MSTAREVSSLLVQLGVDPGAYEGGTLAVRSPIDGAVIGQLRETTAAEVTAAIGKAQEAFLAWREIPAPRRGELVRLFGEELRAHKDALGRLVTLEAGKIVQEGLGEVQEMIDICDYAVGLSRQLYGLTIATERPGHVMRETWHPLGVVGIISAFNFPVAVWSWNAALAFVCGDACVWKPSEKTPLTALATHALFDQMPQGLRRTMTYDRGTEMTCHQELTRKTGVKIYFADPHSPWQRGSNENANGLIREYLPKGTDLSAYTQDDLDDIAHRLNSRPRKVLDFRTPREAYNEYLDATLAAEQAVALQI